MLDFLTQYNYNFWANNNLIIQLTDKPFTGPIRRLFCHILNAHHLWNRRILGETARLTVWSEYDFDALKTINESNHDDSLQILQSLDLKSDISYQTSGGEMLHSYLEDILFHVINHSTHHRAQILAEIRNSGGSPTSLDYIFYRRNK